MNRIERITRTVSNALNVAATVGTVVSTACFALLVFAAVLTRYVFRFSIMFSVEVGRLLFIWACFLAATIAFKRKLHIRFEFAAKILGPDGVRVTNALVYAASLLFFAFLFIESVSFVRQIWPTYFPVIGISQAWIYLSVAVSSAVLIIHSIALLVEALAGSPAAVPAKGTRP